MATPADGAPLSGLIGIVGPCGAGKSTLVAGLRSAGYRARQIAQEHSFVPDMWRVISNPSILIFLDASYEVCTERKKLDWTPAEYEEELRRLRHARAECSYYLNTDGMTISEVLHEILRRLRG